MLNSALGFSEKTPGPIKEGTDLVRIGHVLYILGEFTQSPREAVATQVSGGGEDLVLSLRRSIDDSALYLHIADV